VRVLLFLSLLVLASCSSDKKSKNSAEPEVTQDMFKKERALKSSEVADFYSGNQAAMNPGLQDETLDRFSPEEREKFEDAKDPLLLISLHCHRKEFEKAFAVSEANFHRYQKIAAYWNLVANCHLKQGSMRKALLFYNKALEVKPNYVPALNNIGVMYNLQGEPQKALVAFERAYQKSKFSKTPRFNLAKLYLKNGLADLALPLFEGLLKEAPSDVDLLNSVASAYFIKGNYETALSYYQKIPRDLWSKPEIGLNLAWTLKLVNRKEDAVKVFDYVDEPDSGKLKDYYRVVKRQLGDAS
jgi:tetratricopeptide (TPR) repeat protein